MDSETNHTGDKGDAVPKRPFEDFVKARRAGVPVDMYPLPPGVPPPRRRLVTPMQVRSILVLVAVVGGVAAYLHSAGEPPEAPAVALDGTTDETPGRTPIPYPDVPGVRGVQYLDPSTEDHLADWHKGILRNGDFVTVMPKGRGVNYLYIILLGTRNTFKLARIYPPALTRGTAPPRKFAIRSTTEGQFQILLLGTRADITTRVQALAQKANAMFGVTESDDRQARINQFMADLSAELPSGEWAYHALDPIPFRP